MTVKQRLFRPTDTGDALKHLMWQELEMSRMAAGWVPALLKYEDKTRLARHSYVHNRHMKALHERIRELPVALSERDWSPALTEEAFERISLAPDEPCFLIGYQLLVTDLYRQYDELQQKLDPILDAPTLDNLRIIMADRPEVTEWAKERARFEHLPNTPRAEQRDQWEAYVIKVIELFAHASRNGLDARDVPWPSHPAGRPAGPVPDVAVREARFPEYARKPGMIYADPEQSPLHDHTRQMMFIHANELGPAESLAYLYYGVKRMPLPFYYDLARHMWDEFRHSQMGMRRLQQFGFKTEDFQWYKTRPLKGDVKTGFADFFSHLTMVGESCSFSKKRKAGEAFWKFGDELSAVQMEFDITDERMHVDFGTRWGPELYKQVGEIVTAKTMARKARERRLRELDAVSPEEFEKMADNFPAFCDLHRSALNLENY